MYFRTKDNRLTIGEHFVTELAKEYGTPVFVTDQDRLEDNFRRIDKAYNGLTRTRVYYACKANTNLAVLKVLRKLGAWIDAVSPGEVEAALRAGYKPAQIMFTGPNPTDDDLRYLLKSGVVINLDSISALERLAKLTSSKQASAKLRKGLKISFRVNPEVGAGHHDHCVTGSRATKFGVPKEQVVEAYLRAKELGLGKCIASIHAHIGSGILEVQPFIDAAEAILALAKEVEKKAGIEFEFVDIGGGFGIPYKPEAKPLDIEAVANAVVGRFKKAFPKAELAIEPGRYLVADTTMLLATVNTVKPSPPKTYLGVDAGFNNLIRVAMYGSYHHVLHADNVEAKNKVSYDIAGPLCESGDVFAKDFPLPKTKEGDVLAFLDAGAYGFTMSSNYNSRPLAPEVLVSGKKKGLMRKRQKLEALLRDQVMPKWV